MTDETPERNRGGRPSNAERRRRLLAKLDDLNLTIAEGAVTIIESTKASAAVKTQNLQVLLQVKDALNPVTPGDGLETARAEYREAMRRLCLLHIGAARAGVKDGGAAMTLEELRDLFREKAAEAELELERLSVNMVEAKKRKEEIERLERVELRPLRGVSDG